MNQTFYEFFAGGGMARLGLGPDWKCLMANDIDHKKAAIYRANFGNKQIKCKDIYSLTSSDLPHSANLAWASFPCQDLSLAGNRNGLAGDRSGTFWGFWKVIHKLKVEGRPPQILVLENVCGTLTSNEGRDFVEIARAISSLGYVFGALVIDAVHFLAQSRPRLFIVCVDERAKLPASLVSVDAGKTWHPSAVQDVVRRLPAHLAVKWKWWKLPPPKPRAATIDDVIEDDASVNTWNADGKTKRLLSMMSTVNVEKVRAAQSAKRRIIGTIYRRTRIENGERVQRAEVRFDGIAGCLRTPGGGSSRQTIMVVSGESIRTRLLSIREAARLMGVPDSYSIPSNYNDGYHVFGDGLAVPAVAYLRENLLEPIAKLVVHGGAFHIAAE
jgi:DNA (cytosine-5)-methyltransferase 1